MKPRPRRHRLIQKTNLRFEGLEDRRLMAGLPTEGNNAVECAPLELADSSAAADHSFSGTYIGGATTTSAPQNIAPPPVSAPTKLGNEFRVNTTTALDQRFWDPSPNAIAMDSDGDFVVTWSSQSQDGDGWGVFAQRYSSDGSTIGSEFQVNSVGTANQQNSTVAMDVDGDFVITWTTLANELDNLGVRARRYNAAGVAQGEEFFVDATNTHMQRLSSAAMDAEGNFVITWSDLDPADLEGPSDVRARLFNAHGVALGPSFTVNTTTNDLQRQSTVTRNEQGQFVIVWRSRGQDGDTDGVVARVFAADGTPISGEILVTQSIVGQQLRATAAIDQNGNFVVTWYNQMLGDDGGVIVPREIYARRFASNGTPITNEFRVNTTTIGDQRHAAIAMDQDGDFVITWSSFGQDTSDWGIYAQAFDASAVKVGSEFRVNTTVANRQIFPAIAMDAEGDFAVAWQSLTQDGEGYGIYAQRFAQPQQISYPTAGGVYSHIDSHLILDGERLAHQPLQLVVPFSRNMRVGNFGDSVTAKQNWLLSRNGVSVSDKISTISFGFNAASHRFEATLNLSGPLEPGNYSLVAADEMRSNNGFNLDGDHNGAAGGDYQRHFTVSLPEAEGGEFRVNTNTAGEQTFAPSAPGTVAMDDEGNSIVVWTSAGQDGSGDGIFGQRYFANGSPNGAEFRVNTFTVGNQRLPSVAVDPRGANGNFVVTWTSALQDGSGDGVYAQLFNSNATPIGGEILVNSTTNNSQVRSNVGMDHAGNFVITWEATSQDGSGPGIYYQRFDANGAKLGDETRANTFTTDTQRLPQVAVDADGDFVITWSSNLQDGSGYGVYARRFLSTGVPLGGEFRVNTTTTGKQFSSTIAMDDGGDFVIAFESENVDASGDAIQVQRYTAAGVLVGAQMIANTTFTNSQRNPGVAIDDDGDFVVTWQSLLQDGSSWGVYGQRFAWNGYSQGPEFRANTTTGNAQINPNVAMDSDGDFVIAWMSPDSSGQGIFAQRYQAFVNSAPVADAGGPYATNEGSTLALSAAGSFDPNAGQTLNYLWDLDADGLFDDAAGVSPTVSWSLLNSLGIVDDGQYTVSVRVTDDQGASSVASATWTVFDVAPFAVSLSPPAAVNEGGRLTLNGTFVDPGLADVHQAMVNWGDGTFEIFNFPLGSRTFAFSHQYNDDNPTGTPSDQYPITVTISGDGQTSAPAGAQATVNNLPPAITIFNPGPATINEGSALTLTGSFVDAGVLDTHSVLISWGDGTASSGIVNGATRTFSATHVYGDNEPTPQPTIVVTLSDDDGGATAAQTTLTVQNVVPQVTGLQLSSATVSEGGAVTLSGSFTDPSLLDTHTVLIGWGDGAATIATVNAALRTFTATHTYADDNPTGTPSDVYPINVTVSDDDNGVGAQQTSLTVQNAAPTNLQLDPVAPAAEGELVTLTGTFADVGASDAHVVHVVWGDGSEGEFPLAPGARAFTATHRYFDNNGGNPFVALVTVRDDDGGQLTAEGAISIGNEIPSLTDILISPGVVDEGSTVTVTGVVQDAGGVDAHTVTVNWGDGTTSDAVLNVATGEFTATHEYADDNPSGTTEDGYPILITVDDHEGGVGTASASVTVQNVAPSVGITAIPIAINVGQPFTLQATSTDVGVLDTIAYQWQVKRNDVLVAAGAGDSITFTPLQMGAYVFTLLGVDDDGGVGVAEITLEAGPCQLPGDTNGDCSVDLVDLNNVRNNFGASGVSAIDLSFNASVAGTIKDKDGLGTGFTHRLPGTGSAFPTNDPNLDLVPGAGGRLRIQSTSADINGSENLESMEAPGVLLPAARGADFAVSFFVENISLPGLSDQLTILVGTSATNVVRGGFHADNTFFLAGNRGQADFSLEPTVEGAISFSTGDEVELSFSRTKGIWEMRWSNLSNPGASGAYTNFVVPWLDTESDLFIGVLHADANNANPQIATIDNFDVAISRLVVGDTNGDALVDLVDLNAVRNNFGLSVGAPAAVSASAGGTFHHAADAVFAQWSAGESHHAALSELESDLFAPRRAKRPSRTPW